MTTTSGTRLDGQSGAGGGSAEKPVAPASTPRPLPFSPVSPPIRPDYVEKSEKGGDLIKRG